MPWRQLIPKYKPLLVIFMIVTYIALYALIAYDIYDKKFDDSRLVKANLNICYWSTIPLAILPTLYYIHLTQQYYLSHP